MLWFGAIHQQPQHLCGSHQRCARKLWVSALAGDVRFDLRKWYLRTSVWGVRDSPIVLGFSRISAGHMWFALSRLAAQTLDRYHPVTLCRFRRSLCGWYPIMWCSLYSAPIPTRRAETSHIRRSGCGFSTLCERLDVGHTGVTPRYMRGWPRPGPVPPLVGGMRGDSP